MPVRLFSNLTLRQMLTLPYIALVVALAATIGALSYSAGRDAVDELSNQLLTETVNRIAQAVERHVAGSAAVLETAFPKGVAAPDRVAEAMQALRTRFWLATSVHRDPNNYAYYGDEDGHFFGLWRHSADLAELRLRTDGVGPRRIARFNGIDGAPGPAETEKRIFDPRERPWYKAAQSTALHTWTSIYIDFKTSALVATRARRVNDGTGNFRGVVATDLSLEQVNQFLRSLPLSPNGLAFVIEGDGKLIGLSRGAHLGQAADGQAMRLNAADSPDALVAAAYRTYRDKLTSRSASAPRMHVFEQADGSLVQLAHARLTDAAGLDWIILVAVPREDFLHRVTQSFHHTALASLLAVAAVLAIGLAVLGVLARDLRELASAARRIGEGQMDTPYTLNRSDEIGDLARSFATMQQQLLTDRLTGLANREAVLRRIEDRIQQHRRRGDDRSFAVMFLDLDRFKAVNDRFGHDAGDRALQELATRLRACVRSDDTVARYAGDEFLLMLEGLDSRAEAERLRQAIEVRMAEPLTSVTEPGAPPVRTGASIGLALYPEDARDVSGLIQIADADMYVRKPARG